jgi:hypothetical protein
MTSEAARSFSPGVNKWIAVAAGFFAALMFLTVGWVLQNSVGVIYATSTPSFVIQYTISLVFFSAILGEFLSRAVKKGDPTAFAFGAFGVTLFVGLVSVSWNLTGLYPTLGGVFAVSAMVAAVLSGVLDLRGRKAEIYQIYRLAASLSLAAEAGFGYVLPIFGVSNPDLATGAAVFFGLVGIAVSLIFGPARRYMTQSKLAQLERERAEYVARLKEISGELTEAQQRGENPRHLATAATPVKSLLQNVEEQIAELRSR